MLHVAKLHATKKKDKIKKEGDKNFLFYWNWQGIDGIDPANGDVLVYLLLTLNIFHTLF